MLWEFPVNTNPATSRVSKICAFPFSDFDLFCNLTCLCVGTLGRGNLADDLSPSQFDSLVKVLSLLSFAREFTTLLMSTNLREVYEQLEEFIVPKVSRLNCEGDS